MPSLSSVLVKIRSGKLLVAALAPFRAQKMEVMFTVLIFGQTRVSTFTVLGTFHS